MSAQCPARPTCLTDADRQALAREFSLRAARLADAVETLRLRAAQIRNACTVESALESADCGVLDLESAVRDVELGELQALLRRRAERA